MKTSIGLCGATGKTPELQIGQVKTVEHTQKASVEITGTRENPILNFNIPKGKDGAKLIVREYFNGDIQILNNLNELPQDTNSDKYGKTVMSVNGIKQLLDKISDVLTKANANTNALGSLTSTVQGNKSDIETKLNNFKSDTDTKVQSINQSISELEQTIETKLNEELTKQVKALQDENKKLNDMIFENSLKENFEGSDNNISDTSNGVALIQTIKGQTIVTDAPTETNPNYKLIESVGDKEGGKISILSHNKNLFDESQLDFDGEYYTCNYDRGSFNSCKYKVKVNPNTVYRISYNIAKDKSCWISVSYFVDGIPVYGFHNSGVDCDQTFTTPSGNEIYLVLAPNTSADNMIVKNVMLTLGAKKYEYEPYKEDKKEISFNLDGGLKSLPNGVCDTIEQKEDGFYLVQRIGKVVLNGSENWNSQLDSQDGNFISFQLYYADLKRTAIICDKFAPTEITSDSVAQAKNSEYLGIYKGSQTNGEWFYISLEKTKLSTLNPNGLKQWLQANPVSVYYERKAPVETKLDIDTLKLESYKDLTYVTTENYIKPVLKGQATKDINKVLQNLQSKGAN